MSQSICNYCTRARALPDPLGCGFHRVEHTLAWEEARIHKQEDYTYKSIPGIDGLVTVTKCSLFERTARAVILRPSAQRHNFTQEQKQEMARLLYGEGRTYTAVAELYNLPKNTLADILKRAGLFQAQRRGRRKVAR
jgi:hypothetical protein